MLCGCLVSAYKTPHVLFSERSSIPILLFPYTHGNTRVTLVFSLQSSTTFIFSHNRKSYTTKRYRDKVNQIHSLNPFSASILRFIIFLELYKSSSDGKEAPWFHISPNWSPCNGCIPFLASHSSREAPHQNCHWRQCNQSPFLGSSYDGGTCVYIYG